MQSVTNHNLLTNIPVISITHKCLQAIKEIVAIAPQEAQWFQTVEPRVYNNSPNEIQLCLSDKLYIPTQNTSATQVDTTSAMMVDFYRELQTEHSNQEIVNSKLQAMTCWCHSHHNMSPNPSIQDDLQFNSFISLAEDQGQSNWQIMLIFNKKDQFYSRVYDPVTKTIHEGVSVEVSHDYNFDYIHKAAKDKFKKPTLLKRTIKNYKKPFSQKQSPLQTSLDLFPSYATDYNLIDDNAQLNESIATGFLTECFENYNIYKPIETQPNDCKLLEKQTLLNFYNCMSNNFDDKEIIIFTHFLAKEKSKIPLIFLDKAFFKKFPSETDIFPFFKAKLENQTITIKETYKALIKTLEITDLTTKKQCKEYIQDV